MKEDNINNLMSTKTKQTKLNSYMSTSNYTMKRAGGTFAYQDPKKSKMEQVDLSTINFGCEKKSPNNKTWNIKIVSWNVAGLRAFFKVIRYKCISNE